jgi:hypothetical protein
MFGKNKTRTIEINELNERGTFAKARYGITGEKMYPITITIKGDQILFNTPADAKVELKRASEIRMEGPFEMKGGKTISFRLWKNTPMDLDGQVKNFLGVWQGKWDLGAPDSKITIAFIDPTAAAVLYEHGDFKTDREHIKASWCWYHATVTPKKTVEFQSFDGSRLFIYKFSSDNKYLEGRETGVTHATFNVSNSIKLTRTN